MSDSRSERSRLNDWAMSLDRLLLSALLALVLAGSILSLAASPAVAMKKGFPAFYFFERHVVFAVLSVAVMLIVSTLSANGVRRLALAVLAAALAAMFAVLLWGQPLNGAQRWLSIAGYSVQPSEFAKPAFVVVTAWLFAQAAARRDMPALPIALALWALLIGLLILQPDVGQTFLISFTAGIMYVLAGLPMIGALVLALAGAAGLWLAYANFEHVQTRVDGFFDPMPFENFQVERAMQSFAEGGLLGRGPGEGTIKSVLPDAHTDFIFAVVAEEYGVIACIALLAVFAFIVLRCLRRAAHEPDAANRLAVQGLALVFGVQAVINIGVNTGLLPPKGMTLPFISAGGSSMLALAVTVGMLLALTRWRPDPNRVQRPRLIATISEMPLKERVRPS